MFVCLFLLRKKSLVVSTNGTATMRENVANVFGSKQVGTTQPYFGKRKQVTKVKFLVKEQNVSVISIDVTGIS